MMVKDFMNMFNDANNQRIDLNNLSTDSRLFRGPYNECPAEYDNLEICSFDTMYDFSDTIVINVDLNPDD